MTARLADAEGVTVPAYLSPMQHTAASQEVPAAIRRWQRGPAIIHPETSAHLFATIEDWVLSTWGTGPPALTIGLDSRRYVQVTLGVGGAVLESVSDRYLENLGLGLLSDAETSSLAGLGWRAPRDSNTQWHRRITYVDGWPVLATNLLARTLIDVHGWLPGDAVELTLV